MYVWTTTLLFLFSLANLLTFERLCNAPKQGARKAFVGTLSGHYTLWVLHFVGTTLCGYIYTLWVLHFVGTSTLCGYYTLWVLHFVGTLCGHYTLWVYLHFVGTAICGYIYILWVLHFVGISTLCGYYTLWVLHFVGITLCGYYTFWVYFVGILCGYTLWVYFVGTHCGYTRSAPKQGLAEPLWIQKPTRHKNYRGTYIFHSDAYRFI